jgi:type I restriction enzyme S subunit
MSLGLTPQQIIDKDTHPMLRISKNWTRIELNLVADIQNGYAFSSEEFSKDSGFPLIRIRDILKHETEDYYTGSYPEEFLVDKGDILIGMDGDFNASVWKGPRGLLNQRVCRVLPNSKNYFDKFLIICLQPYLNAINSETSAVTVKHLSSRSIQQIPLPLPPLPEQRAIVSKIEQLFSDLDNGIENFKKAQEQLKLYRQSVLKAACEGKLVPTEAELARAEGRDYEAADVLLARILKERREKWNGKGKYKEAAAPLMNAPPKLPEGWCWVTFNQIGKWSGGGTPSTENSSYWINGNIPWISPKDMKCLKIHESEDKITDLALENSFANLIPADSILFVVRSGILKRTLPVALTMMDAAVNQDIKSLTPYAPIDAGYLLVTALAFNEAIRYSCAKAGTTVESIEVPALQMYAIPLPPLAEQLRIVAEVERRLSVCDKMETTITESLQKAESLRQSILKKAFEGKLLNKKELEKTRNASDWEPAVKLLERIRQEKQIKEKNNKPARRY